ncbi:MAG TPA: PAS domain S-box protein, partial [Pyrinomonadaceae bacterium]|nr:PAS domain S-box protein [Pyrinomonadaceae bacterium]
MIRVLRYSSLLNYSVGLVVACAALLLWPGLARNLFAVGNGADTFMTHEHCYLGITPLVRMHFISDLAIGFSYVAISLTLTYLVYRARRDIPFHWVFLAFGLFIVACGGTHFMESWTTFNSPVYWLAGYLKLITAVASVATALVLPPLIPRTLALVQAAKLSDARRDELEQANRELETLYLKIKELVGTQPEPDARRDDPTPAAGEDDLPRQHEMQATLTALRQSNQTLEAIIHASPLGIVALDPEGIVKMWNQSAERIYGWKAAEVLGRMLPTVPPDKLEEVRRNHRQAVGGLDFKAYETVRLRKDGAEINVSISTAPLRDAEGHLNGVLALVEDITERVRAEGEKARLAAAAEAQRQRLDSIITSVPGVVWEAWGEPDESNQRINFVSDYVETMLGYTVEEWLATPNFWLSIVHE